MVYKFPSNELFKKSYQNFRWLEPKKGLYKLVKKSAGIKKRSIIKQAIICDRILFLRMHLCVLREIKEDPWYYSSICGLEYMIPVRWRSRNEALNWKFSEHCFFFCLRATLKLKSLLPAGDETPLNSNPEAILRRPLPSRPPQCRGTFPPKHIPTNSII